MVAADDPTSSSSISKGGPNRAWSRLSIALIVLGLLLTLLLLLYTIEHRRGIRVWERCVQSLTSKGEKLEWEEFIPRRVPDDQNFFKAPGMTSWFSRNQSDTNREERVLAAPPWISSPSFTLEQVWALPGQSTNQGEGSRAALREWFAAQDAEYKLLSAACERPLAWLEGDYENPVTADRADFAHVRQVTHALVIRANLNLADGNPAAAARDLGMLRRFVDAENFDNTLVSAMARTGMMEMYVETVRDGLAAGLWQESELREIQSQIAGMDLLGAVIDGFRAERAQIIWVLRRGSPELALQFVTGASEPSWSQKLTWWLWPNGWTLQNQAVVCMAYQDQLESFDSSGRRVYPGLLASAQKRFNEKMRKTTPYNALAHVLVHNVSYSGQATARRQTLVDQLLIACALERYHFARKEYPEELEALTPAFLERLPADLFTGKPLQYVRKSGRAYQLWSVGWNEKDEGGTVSLDSDGKPNWFEGDWVWGDF